MLEAFESELSEVSIVPSKGGVFEVEVDGHLVYSKKATGRHGEPDEILTAIRKLAVR